mmetsp:Transcript_26027/g.66005  ORF Transcript_26027/g.66005 Transcript_26027/m.66005 type:complete len:219 (-) Transcript_26027:226-882(-)
MITAMQIIIAESRVASSRRASLVTSPGEARAPKMSMQIEVTYSTTDEARRHNRDNVSETALLFPAARLVSPAPPPPPPPSPPPAPPLMMNDGTQETGRGAAVAAPPPWTPPLLRPATAGKQPPPWLSERIKSAATRVKNATVPRYMQTCTQAAGSVSREGSSCMARNLVLIINTESIGAMPSDSVASTSFLSQSVTRKLLPANHQKEARSNLVQTTAR